MKTYSEMADSALRRIAQQRSARKKRRKILTGCLAAVIAVGMGVVWLDPMFPPPTMQAVTQPTVPAPAHTEPIVTSTPPPSEENVGIDGCYAAYSLEDLIQDADCIYQIRIESAQQLPSDTAYHQTIQYQAQVTGIYRGDARPGDTVSIYVEEPDCPEGVALSTEDLIAHFEIGDEAVVFLTARDEQGQIRYSVSGHSQGIYRAHGGNMVCDADPGSSFPAETFFHRISQAPS